LIEICGLCKYYGEIKAVEGLDLTIRRGEVFGLLGPNGAGKTTTVRVLTTLARPTRGKVFLDGRELTRARPEAKRQLGVVPQYVNLDQELTVWENMELHGRLYGLAGREREKRIGELLAFVELAERKNTLVEHLSGGMKRRLMIARALLHRPRVLLLDEPTVGLDPQVRRRLWDLIRRLNAQGLTILLTTHYIEEAEQLCQRVGILNRGRLIALGTPRELKARVARVVVEVTGPNCTEYRAFESREQALEHVARTGGRTTIREGNLEDVFVELTGDKVGE
jgi:ABC-2 type transport system ATP-binding protein